MTRRKPSPWPTPSPSLHAGKLEQVGTPAELYRRPATRFVAGFVGESNFLTGRIESCQQKHHRGEDRRRPDPGRGGSEKSSCCGSTPLPGVPPGGGDRFRPRIGPRRRKPQSPFRTSLSSQLSRRNGGTCGSGPRPRQPIKAFEMNPRHQSPRPVPNRCSSHPPRSNAPGRRLIACDGIIQRRALKIMTFQRPWPARRRSLRLPKKSGIDQSPGNALNLLLQGQS